MTKPRTLRADELSAADIGKRVSFHRPASENGRLIITGRLDAIDYDTYVRGNMPRPGVVLTVSHQDRWGGFKSDSFGPVPNHFQITVSGPWEDRQPDRDEDDDW